MTKRYEKFEEWMVGKTVRDDEGDKGVVTREYDGDDHRLWAEWEDTREAWIEVDSLVFLDVDEGHEPGQENKPIPWEVGQVVWCLFAGKGRVISVDEGNFDPVQVEFDDGGYMTYGYSGKKSGYDFRCLFFSEPKIEAELFPPKKPFVPKLKSGDRVLIKDKHGLFGEGTAFVVHKECDDRIYISEAGDYFMKHDIASLQVLGEEIKF